MALTIQDARVLIKRSTIATETPTVAPSNDHTDGTWDALDIYVGELFFNVEDSRAWFRSTSGIIELATINGPTDAFINGGNTYGNNAILGLTDDYLLSFIANNENILQIDKNGAYINDGKKLYFFNSGDTQSISIQTPTVLSSSYSLKLPSAQGSANTYLKNDGSGNLSWAAASGGGGISSGTASGTDTYTATITGPTAYNNGDAYLITFTNGNTTGSTLNINSIGAKTLYRNNDGELIGGDIWAGGTMLCVFNSTLDGFQCIGTSANSLFIYVTNDEASAITIGTPVYVSGGTGDRIKVKKAYNTTDATSAQTIGMVVTSSIAAGQKGIVISQGQLSNLSIFPTSTWSDGDFVYLGATAGSITPTKPYAPNHLVYLGYVTTASNGSAGRMYVKVQNGFEVDELHNVSAQTPSNKNGLFYNSSNSLWEARAVAATDIDANVSNTEFGYLDGVTSAIQTQLNNRVRVVLKNTTDSSTSSTTYTLLYSGLIPANTFTTGDLIRIEATFRKTNTLNNYVLRLNINTSASLTGATQIATRSPASTILFAKIRRLATIKSATNTEMYPATTSINTDITESSTAVSTLNIDWTVDQYIIVSGAVTNTSDTIIFSSIIVEKV